MIRSISRCSQRPRARHAARARRRRLAGSAPPRARPSAARASSPSPAARVRRSRRPQHRRREPASFDLGVWTVHASSIDANFKNGDFSTPAKIVMTRVGGDVSADRANGNYKKQVLYLNGHVVMHDSQGNGVSSLRRAARRRARQAPRRSPRIKRRSTGPRRCTKRSGTFITCRPTPSSTPTPARSTTRRTDLLARRHRAHRRRARAA